MVGSLSISLQCICSVLGRDIRSCPQCKVNNSQVAGSFRQILADLRAKDFEQPHPSHQKHGEHPSDPLSSF